jgi:hypothetical protein
MLRNMIDRVWAPLELKLIFNHVFKFKFLSFYVCNWHSIL